MSTHSHEHSPHTETAKANCCGTDPATKHEANTVRDPVCGMQVDPATTPHHALHDGSDYHFCSARCRERFVTEPMKFLSPAPAEPAASAPAGTVYTCPMHPQIRQIGPGTCPICGMALEPEMPSL